MAKCKSGMSVECLAWNPDKVEIANEVSEVRFTQGAEGIPISDDTVDISVELLLFGKGANFVKVRFPDKGLSTLDQWNNFVITLSGTRLLNIPYSGPVWKNRKLVLGF